jgi:hypothetical protein
MTRISPVRLTSLSLVCTLLSLAFISAVSADEPKKPAETTFEEHVLPIFKARCIRCHAGAEPQAGLRLITRKDVYQGGKSGPAIRLNAAESSRLWVKIASNEMPEGGPPLSAEEKGVIRTWINEGAKSTDGTAIDAGSTDGETASDTSTFWSFQPPTRPEIPVANNASRLGNPIDAFIVSRLENAGLELSPEASRPVLMRRLWFDLVGLPPTPDEVQAFVADADPLAYENLVDRLLASPHYGERWGRHWLDVAGYAESAGILSSDVPLPTMYRYRDYVIQAFNKDRPYDRFLQEQIAGDELSDYWTAHDTLDRLPEEVIEAVTATGYLRCAADSSRPDFAGIKNSFALYYYPTINDTLQIVASSTMGLTLQCARCHSHKYDPISQRDFFQMQAVFMAAYRPQQWIAQMDRKIPIATASQKKVAEEHNGKLDAEIAKLKAEIDAARNEHKQKLFEQRLAALPEPIRADVKAAVEKAADARTELEKYLSEKFQPQLRPDDATLNKVLPESFPEYKALVGDHNGKIALQERQRILFDEIRALYDQPGPVTTPLLQRGDPLTPGPAVEPGTLAALSTPEPFAWTPPAAEAKTSGRRLAFAKWLTQPEHPLTARVLVNRVWRQHFGEGIVATPEDFGNLGAPPSHPELLDWLAREFVREGWSVKQLHRLIVTSSAYRQSSALDEARHAKAVGVDPANRLLWRQRLRRLESEPIRDAMLAVSGQLDDRLHGPATPISQNAEGAVAPAGPGAQRRSVYLEQRRSQPVDTLLSFDQPVMEINCTQRKSSTVPTQALLMLNSDVTGNAAQGFAERLLVDSSTSYADRAVALAFSREAMPDEKPALEAFLKLQQESYVAAGQPTEAALKSALVDLCQMLLSANEFVYVD